MSRSKQKGTHFESQVAAYMSERLGAEITRAPLTGAKDRGDLRGLTVRGKRTVVECKNCKKMELSQWLDETEAEKGNDDAEFGVVVHKRRGCGDATFGETYVTMTLDTFLAITAGGFDLLE
ncbi:MAG: hypothetical protein IJ586_00085 [Alloprevotella sp.]|nr:hypothetical protein [Alloprevotella sp.]